MMRKKGKDSRVSGRKWANIIMGNAKGKDKSSYSNATSGESEKKVGTSEHNRHWTTG
jgi:hypothetical protein